MKILYHCCSIYSPTSTFILPLLCCLHHHWQPVVHSYHKMWSLFPFSHFMTPVMWECMCSVSIHPAVHVAFDLRDRLVFDKETKQNTVNSYFSHFPCLSFAGLFFFWYFLLSFFFLFMIYLFCPWYGVAAVPWDASSINLTFFILSNLFDTYICFLSPPPHPYSLVQKLVKSFLQIHSPWSFRPVLESHCSENCACSMCKFVLFNILFCCILFHSPLCH